MTPEQRQALRGEAERAVQSTYTTGGQVIWWAHHDKQSPEEQIRLERQIILASEGNYG